MPVTVIVYVPAVVPELPPPPPPPPPLFPPLPHATAPTVRATSSIATPSKARRVLRLAAVRKRNTHAKAAPPARYRGVAGRLG